MVLNPDQSKFLEKLKGIIEQHIAPNAEKVDRAEEFDPKTVELFWELGILQIMLPRDYGGRPESPCLLLCLCVEEIAKACASSALLPIIQAVGGYPILVAGTPGQKEQYLPRLSSGRNLVAYLVTEPQAGSDVAGISAKAERRGASYVLKGHKVFATNGGLAGLYSVLAKTGERELSFFVVERERPGVVIGKKESKCGFRGSNTSEVILEDVEVPEDNLLGHPGDGFLIAMSDFDMSRPAVAALSLGLAQGAFHHALSFVRAKHARGNHLHENQGVHFLLADAATAIEAGKGLMQRAALAHDRGEKNTKLASMAKCFCSDAAVKISNDMIQILGDSGYTKASPLERFFRDAKLTQIFEGTNQIQRLVIARELYKAQTEPTPHQFHRFQGG